MRQKAVVDLTDMADGFQGAPVVDNRTYSLLVEARSTGTTLMSEENCSPNPDCHKLARDTRSQSQQDLMWKQSQLHHVRQGQQQTIIYPHHQQHLQFPQRHNRVPSPQDVGLNRDGGGDTISVPRPANTLPPQLCANCMQRVDNDAVIRSPHTGHIHADNHVPAFKCLTQNPPTTVCRDQSDGNRFLSEQANQSQKKTKLGISSSDSGGWNLGAAETITQHRVLSHHFGCCCCCNQMRFPGRTAFIDNAQLDNNDWQLSGRGSVSVSVGTSHGSETETATGMPRVNKNVTTGEVQNLHIPSLRGPSMDRSYWSSVIPRNISTYCQVSGHDSDDDLAKLGRCWSQLFQCGFYYPGMSSEEATDELSKCMVGTFLLRDSSNSKFLITLSMLTARGATNVRIVYDEGDFHLDCRRQSRRQMPTADSVLALVQAYIDKWRSGKPGLFHEASGRKDTQIKLTKPRYKSALPLKHMCRKRINFLLRRHSSLQSTNKQWQHCQMLKHSLPKPLLEYVNDYPHFI